MTKIKIFTGPSASCNQGNYLESLPISWNDITQEVTIPKVTDRIFLKLSSCFYRYTTYFTISHPREANCFSIVLPLSRPFTAFRTYRLIFNHPRSLFGLSSPAWKSYCVNWIRAIFKPVAFCNMVEGYRHKNNKGKLFDGSGILKFFGDESSDRI